MKISFTTSEKQLISHQLQYMAEVAAESSDRELSKELSRVAWKFTPNSTDIDLRRGQVDLILGIVSRTVHAIESELIPEVEASTKTTEEKEKLLSRGKVLIESANGLIVKLKEKFNAE